MFKLPITFLIKIFRFGKEKLGMTIDFTANISATNFLDVAKENVARVVP